MLSINVIVTIGATSKGLVSQGIVDMHGKLYHPTWTRLARTVAANSSYVYLQDNVNWYVLLLTRRSIYHFVIS
jgi:hypothetical protein